MFRENIFIVRWKNFLRRRVRDAEKLFEAVLFIFFNYFNTNVIYIKSTGYVLDIVLLLNFVGIYYMNAMSHDLYT